MTQEYINNLLRISIMEEVNKRMGKDFENVNDLIEYAKSLEKEKEQLKEKVKNVREKLFNLLGEYEIGNYDNNIHQFYKDVYDIHNKLMELAE